jgi:hypothetical protein
MVDRGRVERPLQGPVHHIIALRPIFAAHVLDRDDVAGADQLGVGGRKDVFGPRAEPAAGGRLFGRIGRPVEHDRERAGASCRPPGNDQHREKLRPVAHRDHDFAADVLELAARSIELLRDVAALGDRRDDALELGRDVAAGLNGGLHIGFGERRRGEPQRGGQRQF